MVSGLLLGFVLLMLEPLPAIAQTAGPPEDLVRLERSVSLRIAHARDEGPASMDQLKKIRDAQQADLEGESALKSGDYKSASAHFVKAGEILHEIGM